MRFRKNAIYILFTLTAIGSASALTSNQEPAPEALLLPGSGAAQTDMTETADSAEFLAADSAAIVTPDSLATLCGEAFKAIQLMKFAGEANETIYPEAYRCYEMTADALIQQEEGSRGYAQCKEILRDIDTELFKGAFFYSGQSQQEELNKYARAYLDIQMLPQFAGETWNRNPQVFPFITYIAASSAYNGKEWEKAIEYFKLFFSSGATERREQVYLFMGQACLNAKNYPLAISTMLTGTELYPTNDMLPMIGVQACVDGGHAQYLQEFLNKALALKPRDERLLTLQGQLHEDRNDYKAAIDVFSTLGELKPNSLSVAKHLGMNYYNMAVGYFNRAINENDEKAARRMRRQAKNYFDAAAVQFRQVLDTDPMAVKYMKSLGVCYLCLEDKEAFGRINERLTALGHDPLGDMFMPPMMSYSESGGKNFATSGLTDLTSGTGAEAPIYSEYAREYITEALGKWSAKKEFEPLDDYRKRVNDNTMIAEYDRLSRKCAEEYLDMYAQKLRLNNLRLEPYDATNEVFMIDTDYGPVYVKVPLKDNEAETFKATFAGISFRSPRYFIDETGVRIASITFVTPGGKTYTYDNDKALAYNSYPEIDIDFNSILRGRNNGQATARNTRKVTIQKKSDVDENIPVSSKKAENSVALIIANEEYANVPDVASANNDGTTFAEYCRSVMGMPARNVTLLENATLANTLRAVSDLRNRVDALGGNADVIVYYAGHGMPDERTRDAYILPVDGDATVSETCYPLSRLYAELGDLNAKSVAVFIDACFSGAQRQQDGDMLTQARAVVIKPKETAPKGNMLVLSAASGNETALPYAEKNHGLFTYYLLKKLKDTKGNTTLKELSDYVIENVKRQSNFINSKPQTPTATTSGAMSELWRTKKFRP